VKKQRAFKTGTHTDTQGRRHKITDADIREIVESYDPTLHEAPLVIGHPKMDSPAFGRVKSLELAGDFLDAEPHKVDPQFADWVNKGYWDRISIALWGRDQPGNPKPGKLYLRHIGYLGGTPPAVSGLPAASFAAGDGFMEFADWNGLSIASLFRRLKNFLIDEKGQERADAIIPEFELESLQVRAAQKEADETAIAYAQPPSEEDNKAAIAWLEKAIARHERHMNGSEKTSEASQMKMMQEMKKALAALQGDDADAFAQSPSQGDTVLTKEQLEARAAEQAAKDTELKAREQTLRDAEAKRNRETIAARVKAVVTAGRILPRDLESAVAFAASLDAAATIEFGQGEAKEKKPAAEWFLAFLEAQPVRVDFTERSRAGADADQAITFAAPAGYSVDAARLELHNKALAHQRAHPNTTYEAALAAVGN